MGSAEFLQTYISDHFNSGVCSFLEIPAVILGVQRVGFSIRNKEVEQELTPTALQSCDQHFHN